MFHVEDRATLGQFFLSTVRQCLCFATLEASWPSSFRSHSYLLPFCYKSTKLIDKCSHTQFYVDSRVPTQVLKLLQQVLYPLGRLLRSCIYLPFILTEGLTELPRLTLTTDLPAQSSWDYISVPQPAPHHSSTTWPPPCHPPLMLFRSLVPGISHCVLGFHLKAGVSSS